MAESRLVMVTADELRTRLRRLKVDLQTLRELPSEEFLLDAIRETEWLLNDPAADPWDSCLDVDPFTGKPDHQHGDACPDCCQS